MLDFSLQPFPVISTDRLNLRQLTPQDDVEIFSIRSNVSVGKFLLRPLSTRIEEAQQFIARINNSINENESAYWGITIKQSNKVIGTICLWNISKENHRAEIGFELHPDHQGKGYMQEALIPQFFTMDLKI